MKTETIQNIMLSIVTITIIIGIIALILGKVSYVWDKELTLCEEKGGVLITYECFESIMSIMRCDKVETGQYCMFPNQTKYKIIYP